MVRKAIVIAANPNYTLNNNEWDSFRAEGRTMINMGFGISLLGYDVNIACPHWNMESPKKTWNNIILSKAPIYDHYDFALTFSSFEMLGSNFDTGLSIVYEYSHIKKTKEFIKTTGKSVKYVSNHRDSINGIIDLIHSDDGTDEEANWPVDVIYVPTIFPIPRLSQGFIPCSYEQKPNRKLNLFLYYTGWPQNLTISGDRFTNKMQFVLDHLKSKGYKIYLEVLVLSRRSSCPIVNNKLDQSDISFYYSEESNYRDIIQMIQCADICMTYGAPVFSGCSAPDIISMGKPLIYLGDGRMGIETTHCTNILYQSPETIIYMQEKDDESKIKLDKIMEDPCAMWKKHAEIFRDNDFNNWKKFIALKGIIPMDFEIWKKIVTEPGGI